MSAEELTCQLNCKRKLYSTWWWSIFSSVVALVLNAGPCTEGSQPHKLRLYILAFDFHFDGAIIESHLLRVDYPLSFESVLTIHDIKSLPISRFYILMKQFVKTLDICT